MYLTRQRELAEHVRNVVRAQYQIELDHVVIEQPPNVALGEYALPLAFELAKKLRKAPRKIAEEIVSALGAVPGFAKFEIAGAGYINARLERAAFAQELLQASPQRHRETEKILVEHTSINPNKAAHIGHLRNAILGDTFVRLLRAAGAHVDVQNYIDNTGVQVADVVVGFVHLEKKSEAEIEALIKDARFDYICWDVYARASQWYEADKENLKRRSEVLHAIEHGKNETARIAEIISTAVLRRHLETMERLEIEYDFLPRESEILHLHFWEAAFEKLKARGVLRHETQGKNAGCWVMSRGSTAESAEDAEDNQKVIVRSNGTVTYVGKDIAYHLWKFGLLGRDFGYRKFFKYPNRHECWISAEQGEREHPHFGGVQAIYNVIDSRQADPQNNVIEAIRALGHAEQAAHYKHFSYEMVALTPRCAAELGYALAPDEEKKAYIEVSGRRGFGVKADDLIDKLIKAARTEVDARHQDIPEAERAEIATQIAIGALRYFMLKYTKNSVIAFDFKDALSFEGETGPYAQYAVVRAKNIFRKAGIEEHSALSSQHTEKDFARFFDGEHGDEFWELWLAAAKVAYTVEQCIATTEPAYAAKYAFQLAQLFNNFYHRHHILTETDEAKKQFLLTTVAVVVKALTATLELMGIEAPRVM